MFLPTKRTAALLNPEKAGELYRRLFIGCFHKSNLAYVDGVVELPELQGCTAIMLWRLQTEAADWLATQGIRQAILPLELADLLEEEEPRNPDWALHVRILRHLVAFGLLEAKFATARAHLPQAYRATALLQEFLSFPDPS